MLFQSFAAQFKQNLRRLALPLAILIGFFLSAQALQASSVYEPFNGFASLDTVPKTITVTVNSTSSTDETTTINIGGPDKVLSITPKLSDKEQPLYILDGVQISHDQMGKIDPTTIESIDVLKGEGAIKAYGEAGKNGVVKIQSKGKQGSKTQSSSNTVTLNLNNSETVKTNSETIEINATGQNLNIGSGTKPMTSKPLVFIDGVNKGRMNYGESGAPISGLNPGDIKKIEIIKGDKAIKQYGKDAEEGVILITTKNGKE
jgi:outer membrane cobalamin receptor